MSLPFNISPGIELVENVDDAHFVDVEVLITRITRGYILSVVLALGIFGNIMNVIVFWREPTLSSTYTFLRCLSVSDLISSVLYVVYCVYYGYLAGTTRYNYIVAFIFLYILYPLAVTSTGTSLLLLYLILIDRYIAVCHIYKAEDLLKPKRAKKFIVAAVILSLLVGIFFRVAKINICVYYHPYAHPRFWWYKGCDIKYLIVPKNISRPLAIIFIILCITPAVILTALTVQALRKRCRVNRGNGRGHKLEKNLIRFLLLIEAEYVLCILLGSIPRLVVSLLEEHNDTYEITVRKLQVVFFMSIACLNFYLYIAGNGSFRRKVRALIYGAGE